MSSKDTNNRHEVDQRMVQKIVREHIIGIIARQAMNGVPWHELWSETMLTHGISVHDVESEMKRRTTGFLVAPAMYYPSQSTAKLKLALFVISVWAISTIASIFLPVAAWLSLGIQGLCGIYLLSRPKNGQSNPARVGWFVIACTLLMVATRVLQMRSH